MRREFEIAVHYVRHEYRELYVLAEAVVLTPAHLFPPGQRGQCSPDNFVSVIDAELTVSAFVGILVHELTHCKQNTTRSRLNDLQREEEAYQAGIQAETEYMRRAAPWTRRQQ